MSNNGQARIGWIDEFKGFVEGYYANFDCMRGKSISYAASFGDPTFTEQDYLTLNARLQNFKALGIREYNMLPYVREHVNVRAERTIDPTLLAEASLYDNIIAEPQMQEKYILLYSRRYNKAMEQQLFLGKSEDALHWDIEHEPLKLYCEKTGECVGLAYGYDTKTAERGSMSGNT